ncbi:response regulator [Thiomicrospira microaerophila]|uniref:HD-GYP domain-containing protein n=1 Tax=Thiomicrospira microaerophila TaxID=406020 RepID=UPI00200E826F|nr:HD domain-containing phosphohydrolase [Thiomicrospira microaerophila]UQB41737.1 response regulator [Thiomicrospira microaerophila]
MNLTTEVLKSSTIFIIDDEPANLKLLDKVLGSQGYLYRVLIQDPRDVLPLYHENRPDLILLDINMPYLDGYQVMEQLAALDDPLLPPIVILTAQKAQDYLLRALDAGARDYINKPFDRNELLMRVRNLLEAQFAHLMLYDQKATLEDLVEQRTRELHRTRLQIVQRLGKAAEYRDEETGSHILRMSHICAFLAKKIGWTDQQCDLILNASPMHDIGKIGVPDAVLKKPGGLDDGEWELMSAHAIIGAKLLEGDDSDLLAMAKEIALTHHEKWDGSGYPYGLEGEQIPMSGRIAALADVFDALLSERPYKKAWSLEQVVAFLNENKAKHFDPRLVDVFIENIAEIVKIRNQFSNKASY